MFSRALLQPLRLRISGVERRVRTPEGLARALGGAAAPSGLRVAALAALGPEALAREAERCQRLLLGVERALAGAPDEPRALLAALDPAEVPEDHGWRGLLAAVAALDAGAGAFQRVVLVRFAEYLATSHSLAEALRARQGGAQADPEPAAAPAQALAFDLAELSGAAPAPSRTHDEFNRMPKGEALDVDIDPHQSLDLMLARHRFTLVAGDPFLLIDECGADLPLLRGKNIVGRSPQCDVVVDQSLRAVSRRHLIVEVAEIGPVRITDISTLGTFVPRAFLDNRLH